MYKRLPRNIEDIDFVIMDYQKKMLEELENEHIILKDIYSTNLSSSNTYFIFSQITGNANGRNSN
jgi:hypothetical protein